MTDFTLKVCKKKDNFVQTAKMWKTEKNFGALKISQGY